MRVVLVVVIAATAAFADGNRAGPDWWSLQPIKQSPPPVHPAIANPIDAFVRDRLAKAGLQPAKPADKLTLIRSATFDLTGLPPTPGEIDAFVADDSADAYEKLVDRLLASPANGERWARHWLDIVRFSESHGFEYDRLRDHAWRYRDYVIRAFNADKPYADFVREQLAGDLLPEAGLDGVIATGMLVAGPYDQAGMGSVSALIRAKAREDELEDMLGLVSQTFLGVTLNCARCHDHKFDPYTARDYYRMKAIFEGVFPGDRALSSASDKSRQKTIADLNRQLAQWRAETSRIESAARDKYLATRIKPKPKGDLAEPIARWTFDTDGKDSVGTLHAELKNGAKIAGGRLVVDGDKAFAATSPLGRDIVAKTLEAWVALPTLKQGGGGVIGIQTLNGATFDSIVFAERQALKRMAGSNGFVRTRELNGDDETARPGELTHVAITYDLAGRVTFYRNGRPYGDSYVVEIPGTAKFAAKDSQVIFGLRHLNGGKAFLQGEIEEARLYDRALTADEMLVSALSGVRRVSAEDLRSTMSARELAEYRELLRQQEDASTRLATLQRPGTVAYAANVKPHPPTLFLKRGDVEKPGEPMPPGSPVVVEWPKPVDLPANANDAERRRAFAEWVVHADNPLTWRVIVNRVWQYHFGAGLVRTPSDFGFNGERPTHPELLDWLAATLRASGGSLKELHRLIMTSATYRQAAAHDENAAMTDADNQLLWRFAPRRLEAEAVRDAMLAVSGKLNREAGGPSARPFRIETFNSAFYILFDEDRPEFNRRAVYRMNVTSARDPILDVLDCPDPSVKTPKRNATTTPLQALAMMNNPFTNRLARSFAERLRVEAGDDLDAQVTRAYRLALNRPPTTAERQRATAVAREAGMANVCWALFNSNEFVYVK